MLAVPPVAFGIRMGLRSPGGVRLQLLPTVMACGVIDSRFRPRRVVAQVKLPRAVQRRRSFTERFNLDRRRRRLKRLCRCQARKHTKSPDRGNNTPQAAGHRPPAQQIHGIHANEHTRQKHLPGKLILSTNPTYVPKASGALRRNGASLATNCSHRFNAGSPQRR
jgi:hypothetical protein